MVQRVAKVDAPTNVRSNYILTYEFLRPANNKKSAREDAFLLKIGDVPTFAYLHNIS